MDKNLQGPHGGVTAHLTIRDNRAGGTARIFGKVVVEHQRAAIEREMGVHDSLAVVGHMPAKLFGAECPMIKVDRLVSAIVADGEVGGDAAVRALQVLVHRLAPCHLGERCL